MSAGLPATDFEFVLRVLRVFDAFNDSPEGDELWWRTDGEYAPVTFFAKCSDVFCWGCADMETITPDNISVLEDAVRDCRAVGRPMALLHAVTLFCCRARRMRPQGAVYDGIDEKVWHLFDACGPKREVGIGNPRQHPEDRTTGQTTE